MKKIIAIFLVGPLVAFLSGCAATQTGISKYSLDVQTKMSNTIFLNPSSENPRTIYLQIKNTSDRPDFTVKNEIVNSLTAKGYRIVDNPNSANYILQTNILQAGKTDITAAEKAFGGGFGSILSGGAIGVAVGSLTGGSNNGRNMVVGGLVGIAAETIAGSLVKDVTYTIITDVQISERTGNSKPIRERVRSSLAQGSSSSITQTLNRNVRWEKFQTRIMSSAEKVNLKFEDALPALKAGLINAISGVF
ncbi:MAG: complement resistance protein TraT [Oligoflexia bacterium]|nr:complement resistance protein TraT [Oligoflexia bacterium]